MEELIYFWKSFISYPVDTIYDEHLERNKEISKVGVFHFLIALIVFGLKYGITNVQNTPYLTFTGTIYYFITGFLIGGILLLFYNLILAVILKLNFKVFDFEGQHYSMADIVLISNFVFLLNLFSGLISFLGTISLILFLIFSLLQSYFLEEEYYTGQKIKYIASFFISYLAFSLSTTLIFYVINILI